MVVVVAVVVAVAHIRMVNSLSLRLSSCVVVKPCCDCVDAMVRWLMYGDDMSSSGLVDDA